MGYAETPSVTHPKTKVARRNALAFPESDGVGTRVRNVTQLATTQFIFLSNARLGYTTDRQKHHVPMSKCVLTYPGSDEGPTASIPYRKIPDRSSEMA